MSVCWNCRSSARSTILSSLTIRIANLQTATGWNFPSIHSHSNYSLPFFPRLSSSFFFFFLFILIHDDNSLPLRERLHLTYLHSWNKPSARLTDAISTLASLITLAEWFSPFCICFISTCSTDLHVPTELIWPFIQSHFCQILSRDDFLAQKFETIYEQNFASYEKIILIIIVNSDISRKIQIIS